VVLEGRHRKIVTEMTIGIVANGRFLGGGFEAAPKADMSDGLLDVLVLKESGSLKMLNELASKMANTRKKAIFLQKIQEGLFRIKREMSLSQLTGKPLEFCQRHLRSFIML
jgi:diacylglycerol kinase family enzyme